MYKFLKFLVSLWMILFLSTSFLLAQVTGGAVAGSIVDSTGAVIPSAAVKLESKARGQVLTAQTNDSGAYLFPNVQVGDYTLTVEQSGFGKITRDLTVSLNQTVTLDLSLQAAGSTNVVDVSTASDTIVQTDNSQIGKSFETRKVEDLPINGNPNNLALLSPNVVTRAEGTQGSGGTVGGIRPRGNSFNIDGVDNNDAGVTGPSTGVIQDAVEEFTLLQNNYNAEFGAGAGGQFNSITKSGTNSFHGSGFTYINSQRFNARSTLEDGRDKDFLKQARYGGTVGGPVIKNKLFFFGAYERTYANQATTPGVFFAPTAAGLNQIAAIPAVSQYVVGLLRNNLTLAPAADANSTATFGNILGVSGIPFGQVLLPVPGSGAEHSFQINIDHNPNEKNQFRYRFGFDRQRIEEAGGGALKFNDLVSVDSRLFSATWVRTFSSNLFNDLRLSYRTTSTNFVLKDASANNFPNIVVNELNLGLGPNPNLPQGTPLDDNYQVYDAITYVQGKHTFKTGAEMRRLIETSLFLPRARGDYEYNTFEKLLTDTLPDSVDIRGVGSPNFEGDRYEYFFFGQDDWKVYPNLTLNLGVRYEYISLPKGAALQGLNSISSVPGVIDFHIPRTDKDNFGPRVGLVWSPTWDNSVGRLLFGKQGESSVRINLSQAYFVNFLNLLQLNLPPQFQQEIVNAGNQNQFLQTGGIPNVLAPVNTPALARAATSSFIVDQTVPYSLSFALSYQRQITSNMGIEFRYLHTSARGIPIQTRLNGGPVTASDFVLPTFYSKPTAAQLSNLPDFGTIGNNSPTALTQALGQYGFQGSVTAFTNDGKSNYDGGSVSLNRRFSRNFGFTAAYTFSKTMDNSTNELASSLLNPRRAQNAFNVADEYGLSALDIPQRFVASFNYDLPYFTHNPNSILRAALGGWSFNGIYQIQSGQPITVLSGVDSNLDGDTAGDRAILNPNGIRGTSSAVCPIDRNGNFLIGDQNNFFAPSLGTTTNINQCQLGFYGPTDAVGYVVVNPNAQYIQTGYFTSAGTAGRNTFRTRGFSETDVVFLKNTRFGKDGRFNFQIGAEIFDLFNQRPQTIVGVGALTAAFGTAGNPSFNDYSIGAFGGRTITMRAKFIF